MRRNDSLSKVGWDVLVALALLCAILSGLSQARMAGEGKIEQNISERSIAKQGNPAHWALLALDCLDGQTTPHESPTGTRCDSCIIPFGSAPISPGISIPAQPYALIRAPVGCSVLVVQSTFRTSLRSRGPPTSA